MSSPRPKKTVVAFIAVSAITLTAIIFTAMFPDHPFADDVTNLIVTLLLPATAAVFPWTRTSRQSSHEQGRVVETITKDTKPAAVVLLSAVAKPLFATILRLVKIRF